MYQKYVARLTFVLVSALACRANPSFELEDPLKNPGLGHFYNLEYDQALIEFEKQAKSRPDDPAVHNNVAEAIMFSEMLRDGALESELVTGTNPFLRRPKMQIAPADKERFNASVNRAIKLAGSRLEKDANDIGALYALVVAHGLRSNYLFLVEKAWFDSLREATEARKADDRLLAIDPDFVDAHLASGMSKYIVGCLPVYLRVLGKLRGFDGDKEEGIRQLEWVAKAGTMDRYDACILLAAIYRREHRPKQAIVLLNELVNVFPRNYLFRFEQVQMYSDLGDKRSALQVLAQIENLRRTGASGYANLPPERIQYAKANLLFWYGDLDPALSDLKQVTRKAGELDLSTAVMAWLRLGQVYDLKGDRERAIRAYRETLKTAPRSAPAMEAESYISTPYRRKPPAG